MKPVEAPTSASRPLRYGSVCSGIEAATVAWHGLGWEPAWFCEINPFASAVLAHHYEVPTHGDFTSLLDPAHPARNGAPIDLLVGGTPCQSFSHAGKRAGLNDPRGQLMLAYVRLVEALRPRWIVWENVPGVLSSGDGRDFGALLGALADLGYGVAYRVLDARYFGTPQRRRRVFVVGHSGGCAERAAEVLFEPDCLRRDSAPRREARKESPASVGDGVAVGGVGEPFTLTERTRGGELTLEFRRDGTSNCLRTPNGGRGGIRVGAIVQSRAVRDVVSFQSNLGSHGGDAFVNVSPTVRHVAPPAVSAVEVQNAPEPHRPSGIAFIHPRILRNSLSSNQVGIKLDADVVEALTTESPGAVSQTTARVMRESGPGWWTEDVVAGTLDANMGASGHANRVATVFQPITATACMAAPRPGTIVRRLTPRECERLQGFPDDWTLVPYGKKPATDGHRYKALGNSMAVPVMRWIGERIARVDRESRWVVTQFEFSGRNEVRESAGG